MHSSSDPDTLWTTVNVSEALPGVATPLGWSVWGPALDAGVRRTFAEFGVLTPEERSGPHGEHDRIISIFHGRAALRADFMLTMGERLPGTSGMHVATALFDAVPAGYTSRADRRFYARAATRIPRIMLRSPGPIRAIRADTEPWWRREIDAVDTAGVDEARRIFGAAVDRFTHIMFLHTMVTFSVVQPAYDQLSALVAAAGAGTELLSGGGGDHEETRLVHDLWACSRGTLELAEFLRRHGYHGPREGDITGRVWREDATPLARMLESYAALEDDGSPAERERRFEAERRIEEQRVLRSLTGARRLKARAVLRFAGRAVALRGVGKVAFLQSLDVARAAARRLGALLHADGVLADPEDVFFLTAREIREARWHDRDTVARRRSDHDRHLDFELPVHWTGTPDPIPVLRVADQVETLHGVGASAGVVEGRVRVVSDPGDIALEPGEILVAHTTDPSWAAIMYLAEALVIDIGGMLSHAAIVARELGVPCVANTKTGTRVLRTGDLIRVDGGAGRIDVLERVGEPVIATD